jgi:WD40 repeat protein
MMPEGILAIGDCDGKIHRYDLRQNHWLPSLHASSSCIKGLLALSNRTLVSVQSNGAVRVWDLLMREDRLLAKLLDQHPDFGLAKLPNNSFVVSQRCGDMHIWQMQECISCTNQLPKSSDCKSEAALLLKKALIENNKEAVGGLS